MWWHDSGDPVELKQGLFHKACGVTTNPVLASKTMENSKAFWETKLSSIPRNLEPEQYAEAVLEQVVTHAAAEFEFIHRQTKGESGLSKFLIDCFILFIKSVATEMRSIVSAGREVCPPGPFKLIFIKLTAADIGPVLIPI